VAVTRSARQPIRVILYLRLSDSRNEKGSFQDREKKLRARARQLGWTVLSVVIENDLMPGGKKSASAFKRRKVTLPDGTTAMRVLRPGYRSILDAMAAGRAEAILAEDLDRTMRDPRDLEDLIDVVESRKLYADSLSASLRLTAGGTDSEITMARLLVAVANKSSRDTSRRVSDARERKATSGRYCGGGKRPYGFDRDGETVRPDEADVIAEMAAKLVQGASLRSLVAELRERQVSTVTGVPWSVPTLREILARPRNAGIAVHRNEEVGEACWDAIIPVDTLRSVQRIIRDDSRRLGPGPAPRWLLTNIARCESCDTHPGMVCGKSPVGPNYRCDPSGHISINAGKLDDFVTRMLLARVTEPDAEKLLLAKDARPDIDAAALRREAASIRKNLKGLAEDKALGLIDRPQMIAGTAKGKARLEVIELELNASTADDPLVSLVRASDPRVVWGGMSLATRRLVVVRLVPVLRVGPSRHRGGRFDGTRLGQSRWSGDEATWADHWARA
jgi:DNA invertase Pin-like site-specific DNA recombinase